MISISTSTLFFSALAALFSSILATPQAGEYFSSSSPLEARQVSSVAPSSSVVSYATLIPSSVLSPPHAEPTSFVPRAVSDDSGPDANSTEDSVSDVNESTSGNSTEPGSVTIHPLPAPAPDSSNSTTEVDKGGNVESSEVTVKNGVVTVNKTMED